MRSVPFFIEAPPGPQHVPICQKIMAILFKNKIAPLPYATNLKEFTDIYNSLPRNQIAPAVFVMNVVGLEMLIPQIDAMVGESPVIFFRREVFIKKEEMVENEAGRTTVMLSSVSMRQTSVWMYGSKSADALAEKAAGCLLRFLQDGRFAAIERANMSSSSQRMSRANSSIQDGFAQ